MKADVEEKQNEWDQAKTQLNRATSLIPIAEENAYRQWCVAVEESWDILNGALQKVEQALLNSLVQHSDVPIDERITCKFSGALCSCSLLSDNGISFLKIGIEVSHARIRSVLEQLPSSYGSPEEAAARRKELQVFKRKVYL